MGPASISASFRPSVLSPPPLAIFRTDRPTTATLSPQKEIDFGQTEYELGAILTLLLSHAQAKASPD